jgi:RNA polymerase sigma factor (sigma-70 family)
VVLSLARKMAPAEYVEDCYQAGLLTLLESAGQVSSHEANWWPRLSVMRDIRREAARLRGAPSHESFEELQAESADSDIDSEVDLSMLGNDRNELLDYSHLRDHLVDLIAGLADGVEKNLMVLVLEGHTVSKAAERLGLSQSAADRLYQRTVVQLREAAGNFSGPVAL